MNVTLIGMSASGKSHIGNLLAKKLGLKFLDVDRHLWEVTHGKPIQEILDEHGEKWYVDEEELLIIEHTKGKDGLLISPPGSVVYQPKAVKHLKEISTVVYLNVPFEAIEARLRGTSPRAIIGLRHDTYDGADFSHRLRELYSERAPLYEAMADITVDTADKSTDGVVREIIRCLAKK